MTQTPNTPQPAAETAPALVQTATVLEPGTPATPEAAETTEVTKTAATASDTQGPTAAAGNEDEPPRRKSFVGTWVNNTGWGALLAQHRANRGRFFDMDDLFSPKR